MFYPFFVVVSGLYYMNIVFVNLYGKDIRIITTHPNLAHKLLVISSGQSYEIISTHSSMINMYITAFDAFTFFPLNINGMNSQSVLAIDTPVSRKFYIPSGESILKSNI